jgi:hypothetical protein
VCFQGWWEKHKIKGERHGIKGQGEGEGQVGQGQQDRGLDAPEHREPHSQLPSCVPVRCRTPLTPSLCPQDKDYKELVLPGTLAWQKDGLAAPEQVRALLALSEEDLAK